MTDTVCAEKVRIGDPDRFAATMAAPAAVRGDLFTLYAFNLEIARAPWVTSEAMIAEMRLQWWRDIVTEAAPRAHEVAGPLHGLIARARLPLDQIDAMIAARLWDVYKDPFDDQAAMDRYLDQSAGTLMWLAALACGARPEAEPAVRNFAYAAGLANLLRAAAELEQRGRRPLVDGRSGAIRDLAQAGLNRLAAARGQRHLLGKAAPAVLTAWQAGPLLKQVVGEPHRVAEGTVALSEFARRGRLVWAALGGGI